MVKTFLGAEQRSVVEELLRAIGEDPSRPGLVDTPRRVVESWKELYAGYEVDIKSLFRVFDANHDEMVILRDIEFYSSCEHHLLPFFGKAHVGYLATGRVIGISKLARLVDAFARRLQVQEVLGAQIAEAIMENLQPAGCGVVLEARHLCVCSRGVSKQESVMVSQTLKGAFLKDPQVRSEFLGAVRR